jgi:hypothetical protein
MNKKAAAAETITWIVAMFILLFLCIIFILGVLIISEKQEVGDIFSEVSVENQNLASDLIIQRSLESALNKKITLGGETLLLSEAIATKNEEQLSNVFKESFNPLFSEMLPGNPQPWWIRIYNKGEPIQQYDPNKKLQVGGQVCNPDKDLILSYFLEEKRLITCIQKDYYKIWRNSKHE